MKTLKIAIFFILFIYATQSTAQYDSIFAEVSGDTVTLWQTAAWRNCSAVYRMEIEQSDYNITWYQVDTAEDLATCYCEFDLSVSFLVSSPGNYHADVYYTQALEPENFIYEGSVNFTIGNSYGPIRSEIVGQYQSDCHDYFGMNERRDSQQGFDLYPVPLKDGELLHLEAFPTGGKSIVEIYTLTGILVYSKQYDGNQPIQDRFIKDELFPVSGIYLVRLKSDDEVFIKKITVL